MRNRRHIYIHIFDCHIVVHTSIGSQSHALRIGVAVVVEILRLVPPAQPVARAAADGAEESDDDDEL